MPKKSKSKSKRVMHSEDQVRERLAKIAAMQTEGASIMKILADLKVPQATYYKWRSRFGEKAEAPARKETKAEEAAKAPVAKKSKPEPKRVVAAPKAKTAERAKEMEQVLAKVAAMQAGGKSVAKALKELKINPKTYYKWYGRLEKKTGVPAKEAEPATKAVLSRKSKTRKTEEGIRALLAKVRELQAGGMTLAQAQASVGVKNSTFHYWSKKHGGPANRPHAKEALAKGKKPVALGVKKVAAAAPGSDLAIIDAMRRNRVERRVLEKKISALDGEFAVLRKKLG